MQAALSKAIQQSQEERDRAIVQKKTQAKKSIFREGEFLDQFQPDGKELWEAERLKIGGMGVAVGGKSPCPCQRVVMHTIPKMGGQTQH